jgi:hypothetical protein
MDLSTKYGGTATMHNMHCIFTAIGEKHGITDFRIFPIAVSFLPEKFL